MAILFVFTLITEVLSGFQKTRRTMDDLAHFENFVRGLLNGEHLFRP